MTFEKFVGKSEEFLLLADKFLWAIPLTTLIFITGIYLSFKLGFIQFFHFGKAISLINEKEDGAEGEISNFAALCTSLSATIGTGNIAGVATAICAGGPGALFWMIFSAIFMMAAKYAEGLLAVKYRSIKENKIIGGPFCYIDKNVVIGDNNVLMNSVTILYGARIGNGNKFFPGAVISAIPQDLKFVGEETTTEIGNNNTFRENVTVNRNLTLQFKLKYLQYYYSK